MFTPHHVSHVTCDVSQVRYHVSGVTCHIFFLFFYFFLQIGWASLWRVCYQRGLPRLVFPSCLYICCISLSLMHLPLILNFPTLPERSCTFLHLPSPSCYFQHLLSPSFTFCTFLHLVHLLTLHLSPVIITPWPLTSIPLWNSPSIPVYRRQEAGCRRHEIRARKQE